MTNDRELLEAAAKAVGIKVGDAADSEARALSGPGLWFHNDARGHPMCRKPSRPGNVPWDPLNDDGDALRLAVRLNISIHRPVQGDSREHWGAYANPTDQRDMPKVYDGDDAMAATRRAIVLCAAALAPTP